jgi:hypothetical protein
VLAALVQSAVAPVITGKVVDLSGQPAGTNRTVLFTLKNCGTNPARVVGSSVIVPPVKEIVPNQASILTGTLVGNDVIECGSTLGQTYYEVTLKQGSSVIYTKNYFISGGTWNIATANALNTDPTAFLTGRDVRTRVFHPPPLPSAINANIG